MATRVKTRSDAPASAQLRDELAAVDRDLAAAAERQAASARAIEQNAVAAFRGREAAKNRITALEDERLREDAARRRLEAARRVIQGELAEAERAEARELARARAAEAAAFADALEARGAAVDKSLEDFVRGYLSLRDDLTSAHRRGFGPGPALVESALVAAWRVALWRAIPELQVPAPEGNRRTFSDLTRAWAGAARGAAGRLGQPPAGPSPGLGEVAGGAAAPTQPTSAARDIHAAALSGDDPTFTVYKDRAAADAAHAAAARGPTR
jgi:hypothetical protein